MGRFPLWYKGTGTNDEALYGKIGLDYKTINPVYCGSGLERFDDGTWMNEWGVRRGSYHYGIPLTVPLKDARTVSDIEKYPGPDPSWYHVKLIGEQLAWAKDYCLIGGYWSSIFHDATELLDMEIFFMSMYSDEALVFAVLEKCFTFYYELDRRVFEANPGTIDMYFIANDFGTQQILFMSPGMRRKFFKLYIAQLMTQAKKYGCVTALHFCGSIRDIIDDLIEINVDAINPIQVNAVNMDPVKLVKEFEDTCVFFGGIDENEILLHRSEQEVRNETRRIIDTLGKYGRYIVATSHDFLLPEVPARNIIAMYDEAKKYGLGINYF
jgi:uroporphyrinogen decarboxylase